MANEWDDKPTILRKSRPTGKEAHSNAAINQALASGNAVITKKHSAGGNKQHAGSTVPLVKLEQETEEFKVRKVDSSVAKEIAKARLQKGLTQKELATLINEKPQVIQEYELANAVPNQQILAKLERALGVKLSGENIGTPLKSSKRTA